MTPFSWNMVGNVKGTERIKRLGKVLKKLIDEAKKAGESKADVYRDPDNPRVFRGKPGTGERYINAVLYFIARGMSIPSAIKMATSLCHAKYGKGACMGIQGIVTKALGVDLKKAKAPARKAASEGEYPVVSDYYSFGSPRGARSDIDHGIIKAVRAYGDDVDGDEDGVILARLYTIDVIERLLSGEMDDMELFSVLSELFDGLPVKRWVRKLIAVYEGGGERAKKFARRMGMNALVAGVSMGRIVRARMIRKMMEVE